MQSRMDRYNNLSSKVHSRTEKNNGLYENVRNSSIADFNINSNISVIEENADNINLNDVTKMLDKKYNEYQHRRTSIEIPKYEDYLEEKYERKLEDIKDDTKEYDINAILAKAKKGKNVDYNKERFKKVRETQFEILNNLDLEKKLKEENDYKAKNKQAEENLMDLINTITQIENKNKVYKETKGFDLLSDLMDEVEECNKANEAYVKEQVEKVIPHDIPTPEKQNNIKIEPIKVEPKPINKSEAILPKEDIKQDIVLPNKEEKKEIVLPKEESKEDKNDITQVINLPQDYSDDFSDISKRDDGSIILKIIIFVIVIALVIGAVYILNSILDLGLF